MMFVTDNGHSAGTSERDGRTTGKRQTTESRTKTTHAHYWPVHSTWLPGYYYTTMTTSLQLLTATIIARAHSFPHFCGPRNFEPSRRIFPLPQNFNIFAEFHGI